ncbi:MAG: RDD family protein, partial [Micromonosporaceae bacterium]|nr:RDD family protein [Micromonosporaceae bacterium]
MSNYGPPGGGYPGSQDPWQSGNDPFGNPPGGPYGGQPPGQP